MQRLLATYGQASPQPPGHHHVGTLGQLSAQTDFLRGLVVRGLVGVQLAIPDAHAGLKAAIAKVLGRRWQRCTVHFLRHCPGHARRDRHGLLAALIRPIFNAEKRPQARDRLSEAVVYLEGWLDRVAKLLEDAEADILAITRPGRTLAQAQINQPGSSA